MISERFADCILESLARSAPQFSSRSIIKNFGLNITITVGMIQNIIPHFGVNLSTSQEVVIYSTIYNSRVTFTEKG